MAGDHGACRDAGENRRVPARFPGSVLPRFLILPDEHPPRLSCRLQIVRLRVSDPDCRRALSFAVDGRRAADGAGRIHRMAARRDAHAILRRGEMDRAVRCAAVHNRPSAGRSRAHGDGGDDCAYRIGCLSCGGSVLSRTAGGVGDCSSLPARDPAGKSADQLSSVGHSGLRGNPAGRLVVVARAAAARAGARPSGELRFDLDRAHRLSASDRPSGAYVTEIQFHERILSDGLRRATPAPGRHHRSARVRGFGRAGPGPPAGGATALDSDVGAQWVADAP